MAGVTVHGPYKHRTRWRLHIKEGSRTIASKSYPTRKEAREARAGYEELTSADTLWAQVARLEEELAIARARAEAAASGPTTIGELIDGYVMYLRDHKQRKPQTVTTTRNQLKAILGSVRDVPARGLTRARAESLYRERATQCAAATHHGDLRQARAMWRWAAKKRLVRPNVWDDIESIGTPNQGKEQLHPMSAKFVYRRALIQSAQPIPTKGRWRNQPKGAGAVLCLLILGMRPGEIVSLTPWDLDGGLMRIKQGKTKNARRWVRIPAPVWASLKPHVTRAREAGQERIFPFTVNWVNNHTKRLCREVGVPEICSHGLRGTQSSVATEAGATAELVARQLGHGGTEVTKQHYIDPASAREADIARAFAELSDHGTDQIDPAGAPDGVALGGDPAGDNEPQQEPTSPVDADQPWVTGSRETVTHTKMPLDGASIERPNPERLQ